MGAKRKSLKLVSSLSFGNQDDYANQVQTWRNDTQTLDFPDAPDGGDTIDDVVKQMTRYVEHASSPEYEAHVRDFINDLLARAEVDPSEVKIEMRPKTHFSAMRKLADLTVNYNPRRIGDYHAASVTTKKLETLLKLNYAAEASATSVKNEFEYPQTGYRSHKSHQVVDGMKFEIQVKFAPLVEADAFTRIIMGMERRLKDLQLAHAAAFKDNDSAVAKKFAKSLKELEDLRAGTYGIVAAKEGLDALVNPNFKQPAPAQLVISDYTQKMFRALRDEDRVFACSILQHIVAPHSQKAVRDISLYSARTAESRAFH